MLRISTRTLLRSTPRLFLRAQSSNALTKTQLPFTFSSAGPSAVKYTSQHEWIATHQDGTAFVGITKYAADALGDATYVELPEVDAELEAGDSIGSVESVKSASEVYSPLAGTVVDVNEALNESPQLINEDPMGQGWIAKLKINNPADVDGEELMTLEQYEKSLKEDH
ncbi:LAFE_0D12332g1_1 [Lachancea fermentati]|uniref:Glycine cleavage system H protein n=1 Tax=Lachancea fermentati TaxID=4955 RepID=A0A1G4MCK6_LACFM|nr:LAFE_0D12332g1_1 [Lachancea fermentati]